jgi:hypothetical protein
MTPVAEPVYFELADFVAAGSTPEQVAMFKPSAEAQARVSDLLERERNSCLSPEESAELNHFLELEHILRIAKARARLVLAARH